MERCLSTPISTRVYPHRDSIHPKAAGTPINDIFEDHKQRNRRKPQMGRQKTIDRPSTTQQSPYTQSRKVPPVLSRSCSATQEQYRRAPKGALIAILSQSTRRTPVPLPPPPPAPKDRQIDEKPWPAGYDPTQKRPTWPIPEAGHATANFAQQPLRISSMPNNACTQAIPRPMKNRRELRTPISPPMSPSSPTSTSPGISKHDHLVSPIAESRSLHLYNMQQKPLPPLPPDVVLHPQRIPLSQDSHSAHYANNPSFSIHMPSSANRGRHAMRVDREFATQKPSYHVISSDHVTAHPHSLTAELEANEVRFTADLPVERCAEMSLCLTRKPVPFSPDDIRMPVAATTSVPATPQNTKQSNYQPYRPPCQEVYYPQRILESLDTRPAERYIPYSPTRAATYARSPDQYWPMTAV